MHLSKSIVVNFRRDCERHIDFVLQMVFTPRNQAGCLASRRAQSNHRSLGRDGFWYVGCNVRWEIALLIA